MRCPPPRPSPTCPPPSTTDVSKHECKSRASPRKSSPSGRHEDSSCPVARQICSKIEQHLQRISGPTLGSDDKHCRVTFLREATRALKVVDTGHRRAIRARLSQRRARSRVWALSWKVLCRTDRCLPARFHQAAYLGTASASMTCSRRHPPAIETLLGALGGSTGARRRARAHASTGDLSSDRERRSRLAHRQHPDGSNTAVREGSPGRLVHGLPTSTCSFGGLGR